FSVPPSRPGDVATAVPLHESRPAVLDHGHRRAWHAVLLQGRSDEGVQPGEVVRSARGPGESAAEQQEAQEPQQTERWHAGWFPWDYGVTWRHPARERRRGGPRGIPAWVSGVGAGRANPTVA